MRHVGNLVFLLATTIACTNERAAKPNPEDPLPCQSDADCPPVACGPCTPGEIIRQKDRVDCKVSPCIGGGSVCGPEQVCVVPPGTKKRGGAQ